jgi:hypothetical protein
MHGNINVLLLAGTHFEMGETYGKLLCAHLKDTLSILTRYFTACASDYDAMLASPELFYQPYSLTDEAFLKGISFKTGMPLDDVKILDAMEMLKFPDSASGAELVDSLPQCVFIAIPPEFSHTHNTLIGRNYDNDAQPFDEFAKYLTVAVLLETNKIPMAMIGMAGQALLPHLRINADGLFLELNNGKPSGGSLTCCSLAVNAADKNIFQSFEYSLALGLKTFNEPEGKTLVSTNYFLNDTWVNIPEPADALTWQGVTRRENILKSISNHTTYDIPAFQGLMNRDVAEDGAMWKYDH